MRNRITLIISLVSITLLAIVIIYGIRIGNFQILSISQMIQKNNEINQKISEVSKLTSVDYPETITNLNKTFENFTIKKQKYEDLVGVAQKKDDESYETKQYDISYLWRVIGKYATNRSLELGINVQKNSKELCDLIFSIKGQYADIIQFIIDIEDNSDLYFRINDFKISGEGDIITATFRVRDINIDTSTLTNEYKDIIDDDIILEEQDNNEIDIFNQ